MDVGADRERARSHLFRGRRRIAARVHANIGKIRAELRAHARTYILGQRRAATLRNPGAAAGLAVCFALNETPVARGVDERIPRISRDGFLAGSIGWRSSPPFPLTHVPA